MWYEESTCGKDSKEEDGVRKRVYGECVARRM